MPDENAQTVPVAAEVCPICNGSGFKMVPAEDAKGRKIERAHSCDCRIRARNGRLLTQAKIPRRYEHCELSNFEFEGPHRALLAARMAACRFVEEYPMERTGLLFIGDAGRGKTHLAIGIMKELIREKGVPCLFADYRELLKQIQDSYNPSVQTTEMALLNPVFEAEVLVLDELGAVRASEWVWDTVSLILNSRYNEQRTTIITTNYENAPPSDQKRHASGKELTVAEKASIQPTLGDRIGERMRSRLHEMCRIVEVNGDDYRMKYKDARYDKRR